MPSSFAESANLVAVALLLLLLPLVFLMSFLMVALLLQLLSTNPVVNQFEHLRRLFFLISSLFSLLASLVASRPGKVRTLLQHSCAIDGAPHCLVLRRHSDPHPDVFFLIEMLPHLVSANPVAVQLLLPCLRCCCLICTSCLLCRECANPDAAVQTCCFCFRCCCCFLFFFAVVPDCRAAA